MFCESCGSFIPDGQSFCSNCGAAAPVQPAPQAAPQPVQPVQQYAQPAPQPVQSVQQYAQPVQQAQPVYVQPVVAIPAQPRKSSGMAIAGLIMGIFALVLCWVPVVNWILGLLGLLHHRNRKEERRRKRCRNRRSHSYDPRRHPEHSYVWCDYGNKHESVFGTG